MNRPFKTIRHLLLLLATAAAALCPGEAWADQVMYIDVIGMPQTVDATKITSDTRELDYQYPGNWYYVSGNVTIDGNLSPTATSDPDGEANIILCDKATLTVTGCINIAGSLGIYAQSTGNEITGNNMGRLLMTSSDPFSGSNLSICGGRITIDNPIGLTFFTFHSGQFTAPAIDHADILIDCRNATDFLQIGTYTIPDDISCKISFGRKIMVNDDPTNTIASSTKLHYGDDTSIIDGKKLSAYSGDIYTVAVAPGITGGTVTADRSTAVTRSSPAWDNSEKVTLTLTPDAGNFLSAASWNDGTTDHNISASDLATAQSTGKWIFNSLSGNGGKTLTFTATFTPLAASITSGGTTTYFATIASAFDAVADGETIVILRDDIDESAETYDFSSSTRHLTIDLNGKTAKLGIITSKYGNLTITDNSTGHTGKVEFASVENQGNVIIKDVVATFGSLTNPNVNGDQTLTIDGATVVIDNNDPLTSSLEWMADHIVLSGRSTVTVKNGLFLGGGEGNATFTISDTKSVMHLVNCTISGYDDARAISQIRACVGLDKLDYYDEKTAASDGVTLNLRGKWSLELKNAFNEISAGVPAATVTYYEADAGFDPAAFKPIDYVGDGTSEHPGKASITSINNSDGKDHYIIMHITPHEGTLGNPDDPDYWTDERLLYVMEGASAASRSRGPGISLNLPYLLRADEYDADADPAVTDMQPRHDGAGWYYYKLPASHCAANGYTKSTLQGLAAPVFDMENVSLAQNLETGVVTLSRTTDTWTAELTYDRLHWPFTGTIDDTDKPKLKKLVMKYGGTALITLDTTPASETASDVAKAAAAQAEINAQIAHNYPYPVSQLEWNQQQIGGASAYGWFQGTNYNTDSYFWIDVPFTPLTEPTTTNPAGSANNPWLIRNADELNMLSKCLTVGYWNTENKYLRQTDNIDMSGITDFLPIGVSNPGVSFRGHYDGNGKTISGIKVTYSTESLDPLDPTNAYVGLFGLVEGDSDFPSSVQNVTLVNSSFSATASSCAVAVGGIAGSIQGSNPGDATISNCKVLVNGENAASAISGLSTGCATGAIVGNFLVGTLSQNYYGYGVTVTNSSGTASGYTKRGTWMGTVPLEGGTPTYSWVDFTPNDGAMLYVKKATIAGSTSTNGSAVTFNEVTKGTDRYDKDGDDFYYAVGQPVTLTVTLGSREEKTDIRTFYDELTALTMNDGTTDTDIKDAPGFTMPEADATVTATIDESKWFTIPSNNKNWMSFYHEWKDASGASANYIVTDGDAASGTTVKTIEVKTVASVDPDAGTFTLADIQGGVSFSEMPTLFHYADKNDDTAVLPALLKFTPVSPTVSYTQPDKANQFKGTDTGKELAPLDKCYVLNNMGDFIFAYVTDGDNKIPAHHAYIDLEDNPYSARLLKVAGDGTGIDTILRDDSDAVGTWYSLDGRRLGRQPAKKGIYIYKGKKAVIK